MSEAKFTPGPWDDASKYPEIPTVRIFAKCHYIASVGNIDDSREQTEANAHLICTAPAMDIILSLLTLKLARIEKSGRLSEFCFEGLRYILNGDWNQLVNVIGWDKAREAIAKAEGTP